MINKDFYSNFRSPDGKDYAVIDYFWLEEKLLKSQKTIRRTLRNLSSAFKSKFHNFLKYEGQRVFKKIRVERSPKLKELFGGKAE